MSISQPLTNALSSEIGPPPTDGPWSDSHTPPQVCSSGPSEDAALYRASTAPECAARAASERSVTQYSTPPASDTISETSASISGNPEERSMTSAQPSEQLTSGVGGRAINMGTAAPSVQQHDIPLGPNDNAAEFSSSSSDESSDEEDQSLAMEHRAKPLRPSLDHYSVPLSAADVAVAVDKHRAAGQLHRAYLHAATTVGGAASRSGRGATAVAIVTEVKQAKHPVYRRHMEALVERYLSSPPYTTARVKWELHAPLPERLLRTPNNVLTYRRLATVHLEEPSTSPDRSPTLDYKPGRTVDEFQACTPTRGDVELLLLDGLRRSQLGDDTLPWRPVDFASCEAHLLPLDLGHRHLATTDNVDGRGSSHGIGGGESYMAGGTGGDVGGVAASGAQAVVGGSVELLLETIILTDEDTPFVTGEVPAVHNTNVFILLAPIFVLPDVLVTKFIRFFRSVRHWQAESPSNAAVAERAVYLQGRVLQCLLAYCRLNEGDLTAAVVCRIQHFIDNRSDADSAKGPSQKGRYDVSGCVSASTVEGSQHPTSVWESPTPQHSFNGSEPVTGSFFGRKRKPVPPSLFGGGPRGSAGTGGLAALPPLDPEVREIIAELLTFTQDFMASHYHVEHAVVPAATTSGSNTRSVAGGVRLPCWWPTGQPRTFLGGAYMANGEDDYAMAEQHGVHAQSSVHPSSTKYNDTDLQITKGELVPPTKIPAEHLSQQLSLLCFRLFSSIHIREVLNNACAEPTARPPMSSRLYTLTHYSEQLLRWVAAVTVAPVQLVECQAVKRHLLEVCRLLYEAQNYEMAAALLGGFIHPAMEVLDEQYAAVYGQCILNPAEMRELQTLQELMNPYASFSPSSLNSVSARAAGAMDVPMIPPLAPMLGVLRRTETTKVPTVVVRESDGQEVVNWTKVMAIGRIATLWLRCQSRQYSYKLNPSIQQYLWLIKQHQWTDAALIRLARRPKI